MAANTTWWTEVSGPARFIRNIVESASAQKSVILSVPDDIPFEIEFVDTLTRSLQNEFSGHSVTYIAGADGSPSEYFMSRCCKRETRAQFRPKPGFTAAHFLAGTPTVTMHGGCFLVDLADQCDLSEWTSFVSTYLSAVKGSISPATFILLSRGKTAPKAVKGLRAIDYRSFATQFDAYAYCAIRVSDISEPAVIKTYLADLAASLTEGNVEHAESALYVYREFLDDPIRFMRMHFPLLEMADDELEKRVWESQIKCIFPIIEQYRCSLVGKYHKAISALLPLENPLGDDYVNAEDVELGSLLFLSKNGLIIESDDYFRLRKFVFARNELAHLSVLGIDVMRELI